MQTRSKTKQQNISKIEMDDTNPIRPFRNEDSESKCSISLNSASNAGIMSDKLCKTVLFDDRAGKYLVEIDFDESSKAWKSNKIYKGNGMYHYKCMFCDIKCYKNTDKCYIHRNK